MPNPTVDRWVQRLTVAAMVAIALALMGVGVALYAPSLAAQNPAAVVSK